MKTIATKTANTSGNEQVEKQLQLEQFDPHLQRRNAYQALANGDFSTARAIFLNIIQGSLAISQDFETYKALCFWSSRKHKISACEKGEARALYIRSLLSLFEQFLQRYNIKLEETVQQSLNLCISERIVENLLLEYEVRGSIDVDLMLQIADYKVKTGEAKQASELMLYAMRLYPKDNKIRLKLAQCQFHSNDILASRQNYCHGLLNETDFDWQEHINDFFTPLAGLMQTHGFSVEEVSTWLPTYAIKNGVFDGIDFFSIYTPSQCLAMLEKKQQRLEQKPWMRDQLLPQYVYHANFFLKMVESKNSNYFETRGDQLYFEKVGKIVNKNLEKLIDSSVIDNFVLH